MKTNYKRLTEKDVFFQIHTLPIQAEGCIVNERLKNSLKFKIKAYISSEQTSVINRLSKENYGQLFFCWVIHGSKYQKPKKKKENAKIELIRCVSEGLEIGHYNSSILPDDFGNAPQSLLRIHGLYCHTLIKGTSCRFTWMIVDKNALLTNLPSFLISKSFKKMLST